MIYSSKIEEKSDSLINLLTAQCDDLEKLLALAREETLAAERENFEDILRIVSERAAIGDRLETFQKQIAELREHLGASSAVAISREMSIRIIEIAGLTMTQDAKTKLLLAEKRSAAADELSNLERGRRGANVYLREMTKGLSYNQSF